MPRKTAFYHFAAARQLMKTPRELGHTGLVVVFNKFDGALMEAMGRLYRKWQVAYDEELQATMGEARAYRLWIRCWYECEGCTAHFFHRGLKWAVLVIVEDRDILRRSFLVMESLRNGSNLLHEKLGEWILAKW